MKKSLAKKTLSLLLGATMLFAANTEALALLGDVTGDEEIGAADVTALARHVGAIELITDKTALDNADTNGDKEITADDLTALARHVGGIEELSPKQEWIPLSETNVTTTNLVGQVKDQDGDGVIRVACLGDSITAGTSATNWPKHLQAYLDALGKQDGNTYKVYNHGKGGAAVHHVIEQVGDPNWGWSTVVDEDSDGWAYFYYDDNAYRTAFDYTPDVTIIQFGTNDAFASDFNSYFKSDYYEYLVKPFEEQGSLIVVATPPYAMNGLHDTNVNGKVRNAVIEFAEEHNYPIIDTNQFIKGHSEVLADGLHGNVTGYNIMAQNYAKYIFGADMITASFSVKEGSLLRLTDTATNEAFTKAADGTELTISFAPGSYTFNLTLECDGYKTITDTVTLSEDTVFTYAQVVGGTNLALSGTAFACSAETYSSETVAANLNDGERTMGGYQPKNWNEGDWCGIALTKASVVGEINLFWETAQYVSPYEDGGFSIEFEVDGSWVAMKSSDATVTRKAYSGDIIVDTVTLSVPVTCTGVKVIFLSGTITDHKYAPKLYEMEIIETEN